VRAYVFGLNSATVHRQNGQRPRTELATAQFARTLIAWFDGNARDLPWRRTRDPYAIWVSEIMLQQTQVKTVMPYWERWMTRLPNIRALAEASPETIHKLWEGLGYYTRVRNMQKAAQKIVSEHAGIFPNDYEDVLALPGIGPYTAGAICSIAFDLPAPILDGNVIRVLARVFGITQNVSNKEINRKLWNVAEELVQAAADLSDANNRDANGGRHCGRLNEALMELGALVCRPVAPFCNLCPLEKSCRARRENKINRIPNLGKPVASTARRFAAFIARENGSVFVRQRPAGIVNAHLWEFPNVELNGDENDLARMARKAIGLKLKSATPLYTVRHSITRYRIRLDAFEVIAARKLRGDGQWLDWRAANELPFCSAHRKIFDELFHPKGR
jgi:A/G-specific adenine glycosylase